MARQHHDGDILPSKKVSKGQVLFFQIKTKQLPLKFGIEYDEEYQGYKKIKQTECVNIFTSLFCCLIKCCCFPIRISQHHRISTPMKSMCLKHG